MTAAIRWASASVADGATSTLNTITVGAGTTPPPTGISWLVDSPDHGAGQQRWTVVRIGVDVSGSSVERGAVSGDDMPVVAVREVGYREACARSPVPCSVRTKLLFFFLIRRPPRRFPFFPSTAPFL